VNRNNEKRFLSIPQMHTSRTRFNRDQTILTTFDSGKLIPFFVDEVLPGDTFQVDTSAIIRMTTPKYPVMDDAFIDLYYFYCPNRILWKNFKYFMGEVEETPWLPKKMYSIPEIQINGTEEKPAPYENSILDYMGVPTKITGKFLINALPIRAYVKIWNEYFRDQNVGNAATSTDDDRGEVYTDDGDNQDEEETLKRARSGGRCLPVNKFHDYFTSCLPYPQRGPEVTLSLNGNAEVKGYQDLSLTTPVVGNITPVVNGTVAEGATINTNQNYVVFSTKQTGQGYLGVDLSTVTAATVNELRNAIAVQQYYEAMARGGSRYREQLQALWNVTISDKTMQIPEYLGGGRYHININQVVQTAENDKSPLGETGAMSVTPINESSFTKSFEEHGFVIGVMCVRHNRSYQQGLERFWSRKDRLDYYVPQFANLGEQPVKKKEIMLTGKETDNETFGYQEAWADYRMKPNRVSGLMRSNATGTLDFWHYADNYNTVPVLSQGWMKEGKEEIARTVVVQDEPQFFGAIRVANKTTRCMPLYSVPGLEKL
jgi:hypothetical protein